MFLTVFGDRKLEHFGGKFKKANLALIEVFYSHCTIHHYRISILIYSHFLQFQTNLSEIMHVGEVC